ncbi:MAG TPA: MBL fold metallo-hydrolase RNA specificity domain-containing protein [Verrucomicrobiae bacterium]|nr:MBL fold metallo-hydrolase RNA specificity domain-containing protein [Verrucomicrobiae bacterium]
MSVTITCFGGAGEIGGNKILLEDGQNRLLLDFGMAFARTASYFDGVYLTMRSGRGLLDPLALGLVPPLRGVLRDDLVPATLDADFHVTETPPVGRQRVARKVSNLHPEVIESFWRHWQNRFPGVYRDLRRDDGPAIDAVLITHAHQDHISDLEYVRGDIPAASTCMTAFIGKVLLDIGGGSGAAYIRPAALSEHGVLHSDRSASSQRRPWYFLDRVPSGTTSDDVLVNPQSFWDASAGKNGSLVLSPNHQFSGMIGPWRVKWWPVDHSIPGAVAFAVETDAGWIAYSGDIRCHGLHGAMTLEAADQIAALHPVVLLCEGTRLTGPNATTEVEVYENCRHVVDEAVGKLAIADFAPRNVERFEIFERIAEETGRRLLVQPKDAYLLRVVHLANPGTADLMASSHVAVYDDPKGVYRKYEEVVRARYADRIVSPDEVQHHLGDFILAFSLTDAADLLDLEYLVGHQLGGVYIFSNSPAYDDEQKVDLLRLWNWVQHLGLTLIGLQPRYDVNGQIVALDVQAGYHASGHAGGDDLKEFVRRISPRTLIPIHTEATRAWSQMLGGQPIRIVAPEYAQPIVG